MTLATAASPWIAAKSNSRRFYADGQTNVGFGYSFVLPNLAPPALKDALAELWKNRRSPAGEWVRTYLHAHDYEAQ